MRVFGYALTVLLLVSALACGGASKQEQAAKDLEKSSQSAATAAAQMAKGMEAMAKGMQEAADQKPVEPVSFTAFEPLFPELAGWEKDKPQGEKMTMPVAFSQATCDYRKDNAVIHVKIMDSGFNQMLTAPFMMFLTTGYEKQTSNGYEKSAKVGAYPGWEKWDSESKRGELNAIVGKRFVVTIDGGEIADTKLLYTIADKMDLNKLAGLK
jgi:hypothetical protein